MAFASRLSLLQISLSPREYQLTIAEAAQKSNTLVVLPTGLGKTIIALLVATSRLNLIGRGKKVLVLAPTKPLTLQHHETFKNAIGGEDEEKGNSFVVLTGESTPEARSEMWRDSNFIFATPQTIRNDVRTGRSSLRDVVLIVFDEAHRCVKDYSYTELAKQYMEQASNPLILGLTASPGGSKTRLNEITRNLFIQKIEARSEEDEDVKPYVEETAIEGIKVTLPPEYGRLLQIIREIYSEKISKLVAAGFLPRGRLSKKILLASRQTMVARLKGGGGSKGYIFGSIINQGQAVMILHAIELAETQGNAVLRRYFDHMRKKPDQGKAATSLMRDPRWMMAEGESERLQGVEYPKLRILAEIVEQQMTKKAESKVIVFTQYRDTIDTIISKLEAGGVRAHRFVGQADKSESEGMDQKQQTEVLERFRRGEFNVLVSSSIGEEGLHVPDVDLVVFYEAVPSEIRSIQRRGRTGRTRPGRVIILLAEGTVDEPYYFSSISRERSMKELVSGSPGVPKQPSKGKPRTPTLLDYV
jgi:Fanconi anemia group M protein